MSFKKKTKIILPLNRVLKFKDAYTYVYFPTLPHVTATNKCYFSDINKSWGIFLILQAYSLAISIV